MLIIDGGDVRGVILQNLGSGENMEMVYIEVVIDDTDKM